MLTALLPKSKLSIGLRQSKEGVVVRKKEAEKRGNLKNHRDAFRFRTTI